ncbi:hypothetical protein N7466_009026, partial [Penicillium verhagenii]|uniref:uncharacterized protein n=1 Tax=Penicillium verhagenii TaxID=1562060 RepID=UPI0025459E8E
VIINYVVTSGIALLIIIVYYFTTYEPTRDPFKKDSPLSSSYRSRHVFRPNQVDAMLLRFGRRLSTNIFMTRAKAFQPNARLEKFFINSILAMSDLQIVTGLSILISGFAQFPSGLTVYYWQAIVDLAWFSSLTHLSCLTILRGYLYHHASEREWRLFSMGLLATLLVVGLVFTGNYSWAFQFIENHESVPTITEYAICYLHVISSTDKAFISMVASVFLIILSFASRIVKLHRTLSVGIFGRARELSSSYTRGYLLLVFNWCSNDSPRSLKRTLCYYPVFAAFLQFRFLLDFWASMLLEIGWLLVGFTWGITRLTTLLSQPTDWGLQSSSRDSDSSDWSFGQVVALVLLVAPLITVVEFFNNSESLWFYS